MTAFGHLQKTWFRIVVVIGLLGCTDALAQCANDMDCKGDRICVDGECVDPKPTTAKQPAKAAQPTSALSEVQRLELSQVRAKGTTGLVLSGATLAMGLATAATNEGDVAPKVLGGMTLALAGVATPIAASGGAQARRLARSRGLKVGPTSSTVVGWTGYGLTMALGTATFAMGLSDIQVSNGLILSLTALGSLSALTMHLDARTIAQKIEATDATVDAHPTVRPEVHLAFAPTADGAAAGIVGRF